MLRRAIGAWRMAGVAWLMVVGLALLNACIAPTRTTVTTVTGGDPIQGQAALTRHGCAACHVIPGVSATESHVGPPLNQFAKRSFIGGVAANSTDNLVLWIQNPQLFNELSAMPATDVTEQEARHMAAYLYGLE